MAPPVTTAAPSTTEATELVFRRAAFAEGQVPQGADLRGIAYVGSRYVAVGSYGTEGACCAHAWVSEDGELWTGAPAAGGSVAGSDVEILEVAGIDGRGVAVGMGNRGPVVWVSDDGLSWGLPLDTDLPDDGVVTTVTNGGPGFVAGGSAIWTSPDGRLWTQSEGVAARLVTEAGESMYEGLVSDIAAGPDMLVAVGGDGENYTPEGGSNVWNEGAAVWVSADGAEWTKLPRLEGRGGPGEPTCYTTLNAVTYGPAGWVAVGDCVPESAAIVYSTAWTSADGIAWHQIPPGVDAFAEPALLTDIVSSRDGYVAGGWRLDTADQRAAVWTSPDGIAWTVTELESDSGISALTIHDGRIVAVGRADGDIAIWTAELVIP